MSSRVCSLDRFVQLSNLRRREGGRGIAHLDKEKHPLVFVFTLSQLTYNDAVADELELLDHAVDFGAPKTDSALPSQKDTERVNDIKSVKKEGRGEGGRCLPGSKLHQIVPGSPNRLYLDLDK